MIENEMGVSLFIPTRWLTVLFVVLMTVHITTMYLLGYLLRWIM
jgi:hypothetical protein